MVSVSGGIIYFPKQLSLYFSIRVAQIEFNIQRRQRCASGSRGCPQNVWFFFSIGEGVFRVDDFFFFAFFFSALLARRVASRACLYLSRRVNENCFCVRISKSKATKSSKILTENY